MFVIYSIFKNNDNLRSRILPSEFVNLFGTSGTVVGVRFPNKFHWCECASIQPWWWCEYKSWKS